MDISRSIKDVKKKLDEMKKNKEYKKALKEREFKVAVRLDILDCAGKLELCRNEFERIVSEQAETIRRGQARGMYRVEQEKTQLFDAAVGYMLVDDALYVLDSISSYDDLNRAFDILDSATRVITGERAFKVPSSPFQKPKRSEYSYLNSPEATAEKEEIVSSFLDKLIGNGDIRRCIDEYYDERNSNTSEQLPDIGMNEDPAKDKSIEETRRRQELVRRARMGTLTNTSGSGGSTGSDDGTI